jgi:chemotaxis protein methyltransferase CheR
MITTEELVSITKAIHTRYGIDFTNYEPTSLKRRITRIIRQFELENSLGLWRKIIYDKEFIQVFIDELTVGLTEMFRNADFWIEVRKTILPQLASRKGFSIWHAGSSTGEEVYSMAICLTEQELIGNSKVSSTDINSKFVNQARQGRFSSIYHKLYRQNYKAAQGKGNLEDYYSEKDEYMIFHKLNLKNFRFAEQNLVKDEFEEAHDFILCRNVMIYFDDVLKMRVIRKFYDSLSEGGFFAIGYYDSLPDEARKYFTTFDAGKKIYQKV